MVAYEHVPNVWRTDTRQVCGVRFCGPQTVDLRHHKTLSPVRRREKGKNRKARYTCQSGATETVVLVAGREVVFWNRIKIVRSQDFKEPSCQKMVNTSSVVEENEDAERWTDTTRHIGTIRLVVLMRSRGMGILR